MVVAFRARAFHRNDTPRGLQENSWGNWNFYAAARPNIGFFITRSCPSITGQMPRVNANRRDLRVINSDAPKLIKYGLERTSRPSAVENDESASQI
jgi:hypothetical protein